MIGPTGSLLEPPYLRNWLLSSMGDYDRFDDASSGPRLRRGARWQQPLIELRIQAIAATFAMRKSREFSANPLLGYSPYNPRQYGYASHGWPKFSPSAQIAPGTRSLSSITELNAFTMLWQSASIMTSAVRV